MLYSFHFVRANYVLNFIVTLLFYTTASLQEIQQQHSCESTWKVERIRVLFKWSAYPCWRSSLLYHCSSKVNEHCLNLNPDILNANVSSKVDIDFIFLILVHYAGALNTNLFVLIIYLYHVNVLQFGSYGRESISCSFLSSLHAFCLCFIFKDMD